MALVIAKQIIYVIVIVCVLCLFTYILHIIIGSDTSNDIGLLVASHNRFAIDIYQSVILEHSQQNIIISPVSIQICLSLAYLGAESQTAKQIRHALRIPANITKIRFAKDQSYLLKDHFSNRETTNSSDDDVPQLYMANRIYVDKLLYLKEEFNRLAKKYFKTKAMPIAFDNGSETVKSINKWVAENTNGKVKNLLQANEVNSRIDAILLNVIYFKGSWEKPFNKPLTRKAPFMLDEERTVEIDMMYNNGEHFKYAELPFLDAEALEMPYKNSDLSMLILLPKRVEGLKIMEQQLNGLDLRKVVKKMKMKMLDVRLPKFHIEFDIDLRRPLENLGVSAIFSHAANFSGLFVESKLHKELDIKHKAIVNVDEAGSEAVAATSIKISFKSLDLGTIQFVADHPFMFVIRSKEVVYFAGHVAHFGNGDF